MGVVNVLEVSAFVAAGQAGWRWPSWGADVIRFGDGWWASEASPGLQDIVQPGIGEVRVLGSPLSFGAAPLPSPTDR